MSSSSLSESPKPCVQFIGPLISLGSCLTCSMFSTCEGMIICAPDNNEVWVAPRFKGVADLVKPSLEINRMLSAHVVVKSFWINLVLQVNAGGPRMFKYPHRVDDMSRLPESSSNVDHHGNIHYRGDGASGRCHIFQGEIRFHHSRGVTERTAGQVESPKSNPFSGPSRNGVVDARSSDNPRALYHLVQDSRHSFRTLSGCSLPLGNLRNRACGQTTQRSDGHTFPKISS